MSFISDLLINVSAFRITIGNKLNRLKTLIDGKANDDGSNLINIPLWQTNLSLYSIAQIDNLLSFKAGTSGYYSGLSVGLADNAINWEGQSYFNATGGQINYFMTYDQPNNLWRPSTISDVQSILGINTSLTLQQVTSNGNFTGNNIVVPDFVGFEHNGETKLQFAGIHTVLTSGGGNIYFRPNGSSASLNQVYIEPTGTIYTSNGNGNSEQWSKGYTDRVWAISDSQGDFNNLDTFSKSTYAGCISDSSGWWSVLNIQHRNGRGGDGHLWGTQFRVGMVGNLDDFQFRSLFNGAWQPWKSVWHSGKFNPLEYAKTADVQTLVSAAVNSFGFAPAAFYFYHGASVIDPDQYREIIANYTGTGMTDADILDSSYGGTVLTVQADGGNNLNIQINFLSGSGHNTIDEVPAGKCNTYVWSLDEGLWIRRSANMDY